MKNTDRLFDLLAANPNGLTTAQIQHDLDWKLPTFQDAKRSLNAILAEDSTATVVGTRPEAGGPWTWHLADSMAEAEGYVRFRRQDARSRIESIRDALAPIATGDRAARLMHRGVTRILEDLAEVEDVA